MVTKTACDLLANATLASNIPLTHHHRLDFLADTPSADVPPPLDIKLHGPPPPSTNRKPPLAATDVFVDDFIGIAQTARNRHRVHTALFDAIDSLFLPPALSDPPQRKDPISAKKLDQGDAAHWSMSKTILGWTLDTKTQTLTLPPPPSPDQTESPPGLHGQPQTHGPSQLATADW